MEVVAFGGNVYPQIGLEAGKSKIFDEFKSDFSFETITEDILQKIDIINKSANINHDTTSVEMGDYFLVSRSIMFDNDLDINLIGSIWILCTKEPEKLLIEFINLKCELISSSVFREKALVAIEALYKPVLHNDENLKKATYGAVNEITHAMSAEDCIVWRADDDYNKLVSFADSVGFLDNDAVEIPFGKGIAGLCHTKDELNAVYIEELQNTIYLKDKVGIERVYNEKMVQDMGWESALFAPLRNEHEIFGVASVYSKRPYGFSTFEIGLFEAFAQRMTIAMAHAIQVTKWEEVRKQIQKDAPIYDTGVEAMKVAHDAKNRIGDAQDSLNLILQKGTLNKDSFIYKSIESSGIALSQSSKQLTRLTKAAAMRKKVKSEKRNIRSYFRNILDGFENISENSGIKFTLTGDRILDFRIDVVQFTSAISNLIENAVYFVNNEHSRKSEIEISYKPIQNDKLEIKIRDNGPGIKEEWRPKIFDYFFTKKGGRGLGLGLGIVQSAIEQHKGSIKVTSDWGFWTEFTIVIPLNNR
jgi:signal transduction histidine kinase